MNDITVKNARIYNGEKIDENLSDIIVNNGVISDIVRSENRHYDGIVIDAKGTVASVGFIDFHAHVYPLAEMGVYSESAFFPYGVTSVADAGSTGSETFISGYESIRFCRAGIKCFLNISAAGLATLRSHNENVEPKTVLVEKIKWLFKKYHEILFGIKIRYSIGIVEKGNAAPLKFAADLAHEINVPLMVHSTEPAISMEEICSCLEKGDILSHAFHNHGETILDEKGKVLDGVRSAKERGVVFDVGDGSFHFSPYVYKKAAEQGILPDTISGDFSNKGIFRDGAFCLPYVMTKLLNLGMPLEDILERVTINPGRILGFPTKIAIGEKADITLFEIRHKNFKIIYDNEKYPASRYIAPLLTVKDGAVVWRSVDLI